MKHSLTLPTFLFVSLLFLVPAAADAANALSIGDSGDSVIALQNNLIKAGYLPTGRNTGYFGEQTDAAVKKFQCDKKIICASDTIMGYGIAGPKTQAALAASAAGSSSSSSGNPTPTPSGSFEISGWIPYWRAATGTADVLPHLSQLKSVMPFAYSVRSDGTLADTPHLTREPWASFIAEAKRQHVRVIPSVMWGDGDSIHQILSNATARISLEDQIAAVVKGNDFDGIDIDFEAKHHETINYFSTFLKGLYQRMGNKWVYCTVEARMPLFDRYLPGAKIPADAMDYANDYVELNKYCDRVEIMAYDQGTIDVRLNIARSAPYAPVADPGWVENLVTLAAQTIDKKKLIIGIPTYGYEYLVTPLSGNGFRYKVLWPFNPRYATDIAKQLNITPQRTSANELGFSYNPDLILAPTPTADESTQTQQTIVTTSVAQNDGSQVNTSGLPFNYVTWSDSVAIKDKVDLARRLGVRGVAVFKFDGGEDPLMWSVLK